MDERLRLECLNKVKGTRATLQRIIKKLNKELVEAEESVIIWNKKED